MTWYDKGLSAIIVTITVAYTICALSHVAAMWALRKEFDVAVRSPLLAIVSGTVGSLVSCFRILRAALFPAQVALFLQGKTVGMYHDALLLTGPVVLFGFTCAYAFRGLRLLVMYNPHMRKRWKRLVKQRTAVKIMVFLFVLVEVAAWSSSRVLGVSSVASLASVTLALDAVITGSTCIVLVGKLRRTEDLFRVSKEIMWAGCCTLASLAIVPLVILVPAVLQPYVMQLHFVARFHTALWFTNIQPIRAMLTQRNEGNDDIAVYRIFPSLPFKRRSSRVAVDESERTSRTNSHAGDLDQILNFPPLLKAFEEFCLKALCIESLHFLVEARELQESGTDFERLTKIVGNFIKPNSPFEVNIGWTTRVAILKMADRTRFDELDPDTRKHILDGAQREVARMLSENLANKFRATNQYNDINQMLFSGASSAASPCGRVGERPTELKLTIP